MKKALKLTGIIVIAVIVIAVAILRFPFKRRTTGIVTDEFHSSGTVIISQDGSTQKTETLKHMTVEFTVRGKKYCVEYHQRYREDSLYYYGKFKGDKVDVYYNPFIPGDNRLVPMD